MDFSDHLGTHPPIFCQVSIVLKVDHRGLGLRPVRPIDLSRVESERIETRLQLGDVLASHHGAPHEDDSIAEPVTGLVQGPPGVGPDYTVGFQAFRLLEFDDCTPSAVTEAGTGVRGGLESESSQPILDIANSWALITDPIETHETPILWPAHSM
jgi:hypothetical protein